MSNKIEYQPLEDALKEANEMFDSNKMKDAPEFRQQAERMRYAYVLGVLEGKYRQLTRTIDRYNKEISK